MGSIYGGKRWVLRRERKRSRLGEEQSDSGKEFQTVGAEKEKDRRPISDLIAGILSSCCVDDLRARVAMAGCRSSSR